jgi:hypothetical protein
VGIILIAWVIARLEGISYTTREKVIDVGPLQASVERKKTIPLSPLVGGAALLGGIVIVIIAARR